MTTTDQKFLRNAADYSKVSPDPSTKCGAILVDRDGFVIGTGVNSFPKAFDHLHDLYNNREEKYKRVIHAEMKALLGIGYVPKLTTLFTYPLPPCSECAKHIIEAGVKRVVYPSQPDCERTERWKEDNELAKQLFLDAGISISEVNMYE